MKEISFVSWECVTRLTNSTPHDINKQQRLFSTFGQFGYQNRQTQAITQSLSWPPAPGTFIIFISIFLIRDLSIFVKILEHQLVTLVL